jgi:hypothetical protein
MRRAEAEHRRGQDQYRHGYGFGGRFIPPQAIRALADTTPEPAEAATGTSATTVPATRGDPADGRRRRRGDQFDRLLPDRGSQP